MMGGFKTRIITIPARWQRITETRSFFVSHFEVSRTANRDPGFTIVETMIVLAVTGLIFLSAATLISGKEASVQFATSIQNIQQQIQQTINEVQSGYYPNNNNFSCSGNPGGAPNITSGSVTGQGANSGCIFLGKVLQFGAAASGSGVQPVRVYSIAANRVDVANPQQDVQSLAAAYPTVVGYSTTTIPLRYGLEAVSVKVSPTSVCSLGGHVATVGFLSSLASYASGNVVSGSQHVDMYPVCSTSVGDGDETATINTNLRNSQALGQQTPPGDIAICFNSGTTKQSGLITIGGTSGTNNVRLDISSALGCP